MHQSVSFSHRSELVLTGIAEHASRMWVTLQCLTPSLTRTSCLACELPSSVWADQNIWWEGLNTHTASESLSSFKLMRTTDEDLTCSSMWVTFQCLGRCKLIRELEWLTMHPVCELHPVFEWIRTADENGWKHFQFVSGSSMSRCIPLIGMAEHTFSE